MGGGGGLPRARCAGRGGASVSAPGAPASGHLQVFTLREAQGAGVIDCIIGP